MPVRDEIHMEEQRKRILEAAFRCFSRKGFQKTSIRAICQEAGLSVGAIYTHFKDRNEIVASMRGMANEMQLDELTFDTWAKLSAYFQSTVDTQNRPEILDYIICDLKFMAEALSNDDLSKVMLEARSIGYDWTRKCLADLVDRQEIELPLGIEHTTHAIRYLLGGVVLDIAFEESDKLEEITEILGKSLDALVVVRGRSKRATNI